MIKKGEFAWIKVAFPDIDSKLARTRHMYVCYSHDDCCQTVQCQTYRPLNPRQKAIKHWVIVDPSRKNSFKKRTLIDCDNSYRLNDELITENGKVEKYLVNKIVDKLKVDGFTNNVFTDEMLLK